MVPIFVYNRSINTRQVFSMDNPLQILLDESDKTINLQNKIIESNYEVMLKDVGVKVPEAEKEMAGKAKEEVIS